MALREARGPRIPTPRLAAENRPPGRHRTVERETLGEEAVSPTDPEVRDALIDAPRRPPGAG